MSTRDKVQLSERERQQLASIQARVESGDPELAKALTHKQRFVAALRLGRRVARSGARAVSQQAWVGPALVLVGFAVILATVSSLLWLGVLGELVAGGGIALCAVALQRRHAARRLGRPRGQDLSGESPVPS